jgi:hypothetical protein
VKFPAYDRALHGLFFLFAVAYAAVALLCAAAGLWLLLRAGMNIVQAVILSEASEATTLIVIESIGLLAISLVAFEISQTIIEEQVVRRAHVSAPTRVRRYLSRFFVVIVVATGIEMLVIIVKSIQANLAGVVYAAWLGMAIAALLIAWGAFIWFNRSAEEIEPEAMHEAKREDEKLPSA